MTAEAMAGGPGALIWSTLSMACAPSSGPCSIAATSATSSLISAGGTSGSTNSLAVIVMLPRACLRSEAEWAGGPWPEALYVAVRVASFELVLAFLQQAQQRQTLSLSLSLLQQRFRVRTFRHLLEKHDLD